LVFMYVKNMLQKKGPCLYELPQSAKKGMRVPSWIFLSEKLLNQVEEGAIEQVANVAFLPGIHKHSLAMPDMHFGYGFPIGGVAALDIKEGGLSPGGIGFDINCGVRLLRTNLIEKDVRPHTKALLESIFHNIPSGVGESGKIKLSISQLDEVLAKGAAWGVNNSYGRKEDLEYLEQNGCMKSADPNRTSASAKKRGAPQLGTLGAGNHFLEIQVVEKVLLPDVASVFGLNEGQVVVMIHTGSRGFGHQVCADYLKILESSFRNIVEKLPDRELVYAPAGTKECDDYFAAMSAAANYAWANRQMITHWIRESIAKTLQKNEQDIGLDVVYDVAHNIAKVEEYDGRKYYVHRKGATRAFGPGHAELPQKYQHVGQPVIIPGSMGTASYILVGTEMAAQESFSSVCHGAGRLQSRSGALRHLRGEAVKAALEKRGIMVRAASWKVIAEEAPEVYKDVDEVVRVCQEAGLARIVAKLKPIGVVKG
jgi:tRNA-splicing ligase RtcB